MTYLTQEELNFILDELNNIRYNATTILPQRWMAYDPEDIDVTIIDGELEIAEEPIPTIIYHIDNIILKLTKQPTNSTSRQP